VTVEVGHLLPVAKAQELAVVTDSGESVTTEMIAEQEVNRVASYYQPFIQPQLPDSAVDPLTEKRIDSFYTELKAIYSEFDSFPAGIKLALFDLIFNLGMTNLCKKWPKLNGCNADENCRRRGIAGERNEYVKALLLNGANTAIV